MKILAGILGVLFAIAAALFIFIVQPGASGVVASLRLEDGSEYLVTQRCNWGPDPYTVEFFMRSANGPWGWCYVDHEANRWRDVAMTHDLATNKIIVTERGRERAVLRRGRSTFWIDNGSISRELAAPQELRDPPYAFR